MPKAGAIRRGGQADEVIGAAVASASDVARKPPEVEAVPAQSAYWDMVVGDGGAYRACDVPALAQLVTWMDVARQCRERLIGPDGQTMATVVGVGPQGPDGRHARYAPNPYLRQMEVATSMVAKLSDQLGCTPLARARIGLTRAAQAGATLSIAAQVDAALARQRGRRG